MSVYVQIDMHLKKIPGILNSSLFVTPCSNNHVWKYVFSAPELRERYMYYGFFLENFREGGGVCACARIIESRAKR